MRTHERGRHHRELVAHVCHLALTRRAGAKVQRDLRQQRKGAAVRQHVTVQSVLRPREQSAQLQSAPSPRTLGFTPLCAAALKLAKLLLVTLLQNPWQPRAPPGMQRSWDEAQHP